MPNKQIQMNEKTFLCYLINLEFKFFECNSVIDV